MLLLRFGWMIAFGLLGCSIAAGEESGKPKVSFAQDIRPILQLHCVMCHGGVKNAGDLKLTDRNQALFVITPGSAASSALMERIESREDEIRMPPPEHGPPLTQSQIDSIRAWIDQGAVWDRHWSFIPPKSQTESVQFEDINNWCRSGLDAKVAQKWVSSPEVKPSERAQPDEWLRRASLTLTGLPPCEEEYEAFAVSMKRSPETAYEQAVDVLLASPRFGEHWATMWLDQVRYADSRGLGQDGPRTIWKYRDWVIDAFNADMPYDIFTRKQLAGDLFPDRSLDDSVATAVHRLTQTNEEGGTDDEEFRTAAVIDRVNTTWQVWQGLTFGCAQCHDHPYDPIRHEDYYTFLAYFNNTADWDLDQEFPVIQVPLDKAEYGHASVLDQQIRTLNEVIWKHEFDFVRNAKNWSHPPEMQVSSSSTSVAIEPERPNEFHTVGTVERDTNFMIEWQAAAQSQLAALRLFLKPLEPETALLNTEVGTVLSHIKLEMRQKDEPWTTIDLERLIADEPEPFFDPNSSLNASNTDGFGAFARIQKERVAAVLLKQPIAFDAPTELRLTLAHRKFVLDAFPLVSKRVALDVCTEATCLQAIQTSELEGTRNRLADLRAERAKIKSVVLPVMRELPENLQRPTHVFIRGFFLTKDKQVISGLPVSFLENEQAQPATRRQVADWFVDDKNPLTARVQVNRIWSRIFGRGLVVSEEDFGSSGDLPTNQELLDELAVLFQHRFEWSQKRLIREIILSSTFCQTNKATEEAYRADPENRLLARGPRNRLPAEVIRDSALFVSGLLNTSLGGSPANPPIPEGVWVPFQAGDKWNTPKPGDKNRYRRSVYTYTKRSIPYPVLSAFDAPSREFCTARRMPSNTPVQALMTLNDVTFLDAAHSLASEQSVAQPASAQDGLEWLWRRILGRTPSVQERSRAIAYLGCEPEDKWESIDTARWERMALLLLNHDEMFSN